MQQMWSDLAAYWQWMCEHIVYAWESTSAVERQITFMTMLVVGSALWLSLLFKNLVLKWGIRRQIEANERQIAGSKRVLEDIKRRYEEGLIGDTQHTRYESFEHRSDDS